MTPDPHFKDTPLFHFLNISETVQDRDVVTTEHELNTCHNQWRNSEWLFSLVVTHWSRST